MVLMLGSPAGSYINGSDFIVDGGWELVGSVLNLMLRSFQTASSKDC